MTTQPLSPPAATADGDMASAYARLLAEGRLEADARQAEVVAQLAALQENIASANGKSSLLGKLLGQEKPTIQGAYLWGEVGRGKSLLMDMFFATTSIAPKRRVHYHAFMMQVHARIHAWREKNRADLKEKDPIPPLAAALAEESRLLCLDEFQVTDVADAMILGRLFTALLNHGVTVLMTSNRAPDQLYLHGLQRDRFLKFIDLIEKRLHVIRLDSDEDYRLKQLRALDEVYVTGKPKEAQAKMDAAFAKLTRGLPAKKLELDVLGHTLTIPAACGDIARMGFDALCGTALGAADYAAIAQEFSTLLLDGIPLLPPEKRNEAKRFVTLIDTLYEHKVKLICSAAAAPDKLYPSGDGSFEFARTASRLHEMQSESYLAASHMLA